MQVPGREDGLGFAVEVGRQSVRRGPHDGGLARLRRLAVLGVVRAKNEYWSDPGDDIAREEAQYRHRKVCELKAYELDRQAGCHRALPGCSYDEAVRNRAAYAVLEDLVKDHSVSRRDLEVWAACDMFRRDRAELAEEFGVTSNNLDQIVFRVRNTLKKLGPALHRRHAARLFHEAA